MKEKNMRKIAEKLNRIGKAKIEKDGKSEEYIIFSSGFLPCDEEIHKETLERDLMYVRELMLFEAHEDEDAYADDPKLRAKWLESVDQTIELEAEWEDIVPDRRIVLLLRDHGQGDSSQQSDMKKTKFRRSGLMIRRWISMTLLNVLIFLAAIQSKIKLNGILPTDQEAGTQFPFFCFRFFHKK